MFEEDVVLDSDDEENALVLPNREDSNSKDAQLQDDRSNASTPKNQQVKSEPGDDTQPDLHSIGENAKETGTNSPLDSTSQDSTIKQEKTEAKRDQMESISVVVNPHVSEHGSRFYIKRRVIVGNVSKFIPQGLLYLQLYAYILGLGFSHSFTFRQERTWSTSIYTQMDDICYNSSWRRRHFLFLILCSISSSSKL